MDGNGNAEGSSATGAVGGIDLSRFDDSTAVDLTGQVHQLPCCIKYDGPSPVSHYFKPKSTGFVIGKKSLGKRKAPDQSEEISNSWEMNAKFQSITFWNHDSLPSHDDAFVRSFHWLSVAKALHQPVTPEDLESASNSQQSKVTD